MYQAHYLTDKGIKSYLRTIDSELNRKYHRSFMNHDIHVENLVRLVFKYFNIPFEKLKVKNRQAEIIRAKQFAAFYIKKEVHRITLKEIGSVFDLNHATIIHSVKNISNLIEVDAEYRGYHEELTSKIMELYK